MRLSVTDRSARAATDSAGWYALYDVPSGERRLTLSRAGFVPRDVVVLVPATGTLAIDFTMRRLPVQLVRAGGLPAGDRDAHSPGYHERELSAAAIANNPLLVQPDVLLAVSGGEVASRPEAPAGIHIRGGASDQTAYLLDGIPTLNPFHSGALFGAWNPDAIAAVRLAAPSPGSDAPAVLSGVVVARTRDASSTLAMRGAVSSSHASFTVDGPIGDDGAGFLVSARTGYPGLLAPRDESSYLRGESGDVLATLTLPAFGGRVRALAFDSGNELSSGATATADATPPSAQSNNAFAWNNRSTGAEWRRTGVKWSMRDAAWRAMAGASSTWNAGDAPWTMRSERRDAGARFSAEHSSSAAATTVGLRLERTRTAYEARGASVGDFAPAPAGRKLTSLFAEHVRKVGRGGWGEQARGGVELSFGSALTVFRGTARFDPHVAGRWDATRRLSVSAHYMRTHQYVQSLRDPESIVSTIFPTDLFAVAGSAGVPVGRSDLGVVAAEYRPSGGIRLGVQAHARRFEGLALVAPTSMDPFARRAPAAGSGEGRGVAFDLAVSGRRGALTAAYALQDVRYRSAGTAYVPEHAPRSVLEGGVIVFPTPAWSVLLGAVAAFGRRATPVSGDVEWEACNLLDRGCEFGGSPRHARDALGRTALGSYVRLDLGVRRAWKLTTHGKPGELGAFGALTNVLARRNVLAQVWTATSGASSPIAMRPRAPLVVGMDWRF